MILEGKSQTQKEAALRTRMPRAILIKIILRIMLLASLSVVSQPILMVEANENYPLGIFGNANEDDAIDMRDVTYTESIILGIIPHRQLADANYDGNVDMLDVTQTELIIMRKEKTLMLLDERGDVITVHKPVKRLIPEHITSLAAMRVLDAEDIIVGIDSGAKDYMGSVFLQDLEELPKIGTYGHSDYEAILRLNPDLLIAYRCRTSQEKLPGVTVFYAGYGEPYPPEHLTVDMRKLGYILDRIDEAEEYINWHNGYIDMIKERIAGLSEAEKPRVYAFYPLLGLYKCRGNYPPCEIAGGISIGSDLGPGFATAVDPEWVIEQNPDVILGVTIPKHGAYDAVDASELIAERDDILNRPELANVNAVKNRNIYFLNAYALGLYPNYILSIAYYAKWFHPDLFEDLDPQAMHQEYLDRFQNIGIDVREHGMYVYPPPKK